MNCHIDHDHITDAVKVWLYDNRPEGIVYLYPSAIDDHGAVTWTQEIVGYHEQRPDTVRPALEMSGFMWKPFVEAIRAEDGEVPAGQLLFETLKREQNRVDALIHALIKAGEPQMLLQGPTMGPP